MERVEARVRIRIYNEAYNEYSKKYMILSQDSPTVFETPFPG
jgi:hypothetical protein